MPATARAVRTMSYKRLLPRPQAFSNESSGEVWCLGYPARRISRSPSREYRRSATMLLSVTYITHACTEYHEGRLYLRCHAHLVLLYGVRGGRGRLVLCPPNRDTDQPFLSDRHLPRVSLSRPHHSPAAVLVVTDEASSSDSDGENTLLTDTKSSIQVPCWLEILRNINYTLRNMP